jgi:hypothetical protein
VEDHFSSGAYARSDTAVDQRHPLLGSGTDAMLEPMASRLCAFCEVISEMTVQWGYTHLDSQNTRYDDRGRHVDTIREKTSYVAATCGNCGAISVARVTGPGIDIPTDSNRVPNARRVIEDTANEVEWFPISVAAPGFPNVPDHVARCATEAYQTASIGASMAPILMARTTIEATAKFKGITRGQLIKKIDQMAADDLIRPALKRAAHAVRILGNDMAHGDVEEQPSVEDVEDTLQLMTMILSEVFEAEALTDSILSRRKKPTTVEPDPDVEVDSAEK